MYNYILIILHNEEHNMFGKKKFFKILFLLTFILFLFLSQNQVFAKNYTVKIGIVLSVKEVIISSSINTPIILKKEGCYPEIIAQIQPLVPFYLKGEGGGEISLYERERFIGKYNGILTIKPETTEKIIPVIYAGSHWYRGQLEIFGLSNGTITVVNILPLEEYLYGVIPGEMPYTWSLESLKAQAIAARTYALANIGQYSKRGFDMLATPESQVYLGAEGEQENTNKAVNETKDMVITYNGKLITAYYHSTSGGMTENGFDLWDDQPYLKSVPDFDQNSPKYIWYQNIYANQLKQSLIKIGINVGDVINIRPTRRSQTGRIKELLIEGVNGVQNVEGAKFRRILNLNSTFFNVGPMIIGGENVKDNQIIPQVFQFAGRGWGHGMGMSQWGAQQMAVNGKNYEQILTYYYTGTKVVKF